MRWLPSEGDCHESVSYSQFGFAHLAFSVTMMDHVIGTTYQQHQGPHNAWLLQDYA